MASNKVSSSPSTRSAYELLKARQSLLSTLNAMVCTLNQQIFQLETIGTVQPNEIDKVYERLAWAVDRHWEEQQLAALEEEPVLAAKRNYIRGFHSEVSR